MIERKNGVEVHLKSIIRGGEYKVKHIINIKYVAESVATIPYLNPFEVVITRKV